MNRFYLLSLFTLLVGLAHGQIVTILDDTTDKPLELVTLSSETPPAFEVSNSEGQVNLDSFKGAEVIYFRCLGYEYFVTSYDNLMKMGDTVRMTASEITLDKAIISASRWKQNKQEVPERIITISPADVALQNPQTAADLLGSTGEVFIQKSQLGGGSPMIRGFSTNRLLYVVDGVRMNTAIFRSGNLQNVISLDPLAIEGTEVLFGPGSIVYGSDAIGAVMSFQTLTPRLSLKNTPYISGKALGRFSSANNEQTFHFDANVGWKKWAMVSSFTYSEFGDLRMGSNGPDDYLDAFYIERQNGADVVVANPDPLVQRPTGYSQHNFMQKIRFAPNRKWDFQYGFHYSESSEFARYDRLIRTRNGEPRSAVWNYGPQLWMMNNLHIQHRHETVAYDQMSIRLAHQEFEESRIDRDFNDPIENERLENVQAYSVNVDFTKFLSERFKIFYGGEWVLNDVVSRALALNIETGELNRASSRYPDASWKSTAGYLSAEFDLTEKLILEGGIRYNQFGIEADFEDNLDFFPFPESSASINNAATTGSIGLIYNPDEKTSISVDASTAFRAPNVDDIGKVFDSEPGSVVIPNPDLEAEYAYNLEANVSKILGKAFKVDLTGYYTLLDGALVNRNFQLAGQDSIFYDGELSQVQALQNAAQTTVYGIQIGLEVRLPGGFGLASRFNYQFGEEELEDGTTSSSRHAAPAFGMTRLTYRTGDLRLELNSHYMMERSFEDLPVGEQNKPHIYAKDENGDPYAPAWYTVNFKAIYELDSHFTVSAGLENITDQRYRPYSSGLTAPGRNLIISLQARF